MEFLGFLFFLLLGLYIFGLVVKLLFRIWFTGKMKHFRQNGGASFRTGTRGTEGSNNRSRRAPEGAVTVEQSAMQPRRVNRNVGDYVAYEEVETAEEESASQEQ